MAAIKLLNLIAITTLALFASSLNTPVNALSTGHQHFARHAAHDGIAQVKRSKRADTKSRRCKPRSSSAAAPASTSSAIEVIISTEAPQTTKKPATTTKAPEPAPTTSQSSGGGGSTNIPSTGGGLSTGKKVGIAWNNPNAASLQNLVSDKTGFIYTWSPYRPPNTFGLEFVGMIWGRKQMSDFYKQKPGFAKYLLIGNEPDEPTQGNESPQSFAAWWKSDIEQLKDQGYDLWSPAVTGGDRGKKWFADFVNECGGKCSFSHIALHYYGTDANDFIKYVQYWWDTYHKPLVITEFAPMNFGGGSAVTSDKVWQFYQTAIPWLDSQDFVKVYFPFGFLEDMGNVNYLDQLMKGGQPTDLGKFVLYH